MGRALFHPLIPPRMPICLLFGSSHKTPEGNGPSIYSQTHRPGLARRNPRLTAAAACRLQPLIPGFWRSDGSWGVTRQAQDSSCLLTGMEIVQYFNNDHRSASVRLGLGRCECLFCLFKGSLRWSAGRQLFCGSTLRPLLEKRGCQQPDLTGCPPATCAWQPSSLPRSFPALRVVTCWLLPPFYPEVAAPVVFPR